MDMQFTRGRLAAIAMILDDLKAMLSLDLDRVAVSTHDDYHDDRRWEAAAKALSDAYLDLIRARDRIEEANEVLWRLTSEEAQA